MANVQKRKKERDWWFWDALFTAGEILFYVPRLVFRLFKDF
ncbi:hypothetical protein [Planomicrobium sp. YIM 101495]|nr:hypothetical protein [Planomicrobium sp. YIM 101495]